MASFWENHKKSLQIFGFIIFAILFLVVAYDLRAIFNPVLLSLLLAYILNPIVTFLERKHIPRPITIFSIYILLTGLIVLCVMLVLPLIGAEISYLYEKSFIGDQFTDANKNGEYDSGEEIIRDIDNNKVYNPAYSAVFLKWAKEQVVLWNNAHPNQTLDWEFIRSQINKETLEQFGGTIFFISKNTILTAFKTVLGIFSMLSYFILLPLYIFFLLNSLNDIKDTLHSFLPAKQREKIIYILHRIHLSLSCFFRGKLIICLLKAILTWGCLEMFEFRYALIFALIQFIASIVPFLVLLVGMIPNMVLVFLDYGMDWKLLVGLLVIYSIIEGLESFLLTPAIMGKETGLHPLTVILSLLIGGKIFGLFGLIMSIPLCNTLKILGEEFLLPAWIEISKCEAKIIKPEIKQTTENTK